MTVDDQQLQDPVTRALEEMWREADLRQQRVEGLDKGGCPNGPDEYGNYPCDPQLLYGVPGQAECQVCGRVAAWGP